MQFREHSIELLPHGWDEPLPVFYYPDCSCSSFCVCDFAAWSPALGDPFLDDTSILDEDECIKIFEDWYDEQRQLNVRPASSSKKRNHVYEIGGIRMKKAPLN